MDSNNELSISRFDMRDGRQEDFRNEYNRRMEFDRRHEFDRRDEFDRRHEFDGRFPFWWLLFF